MSVNVTPLDEERVAFTVMVTDKDNDSCTMQVSYHGIYVYDVVKSGTFIHNEDWVRVLEVFKEALDNHTRRQAVAT